MYMHVLLQMQVKHTYLTQILTVLRSMYRHLHSQQDSLEGDSCSATFAGVDMALWSPDTQQRSHCLCMAVYHFQHSPGSLIVHVHNSSLILCILCLLVITLYGLESVIGFVYEARIFCVHC